MLTPRSRWKLGLYDRADHRRDGGRTRAFRQHRRNTRGLSCRWTHSRAPAQWPRRRRWRRGCRYRHQGDNASQRQRQDQSADRAWSRLRNRYGVCWLGSSFLRRIPVIAIDRMRAAARPGRKKSFSHGLFCEVEGEIFLRRRRSRSCPAPAPSKYERQSKRPRPGSVAERSHTEF